MAKSGWFRTQKLNIYGGLFGRIDFKIAVVEYGIFMEIKRLEHDFFSV